VISITVRFFAAARERAGRSVEQVVLSEPYTVAHLLETLPKQVPELASLMKHLRVAVDEELAEVDTPLRDGVEVALIPPVSGGSSEVLAVVSEPLDVQRVIDAVAGPDHGAVATFTGAVRAHTRGRAVLRLEYEAFVPMAQKVFRGIADEARQKWPGVRVAILHRVGVLEPGALAVVIAASAAHRQEAFAACQHTIERLKHEAPIWKKEFFEDGEVWVGLGP